MLNREALNNSILRYVVTSAANCVLFCGYTNNLHLFTTGQINLVYTLMWLAEMHGIICNVCALESSPTFLMYSLRFMLILTACGWQHCAPDVHNCGSCLHTVAVPQPFNLYIYIPHDFWGTKQHMHRH